MSEAAQRDTLFAPVVVPDLEALPESARVRLESDESGLPESVLRDAAAIIERVRREGDAALVDFTRQFDGVELTLDEGARGLFVGRDVVEAAADRIDGELAKAIDGMIANVRRFHEGQRQGGYELSGPDGARVAWRLRPVSAAAVYVPGGSAAYPTSVVMNVVPAQLAGVPRICVLTPPGSVEQNPAVAYALEALGITEVIGVGGAQAIAAAAYGTPSVRPVDVIVGPGNAWVAAAKRLVFGRVGIDSVAGPSEVAVLADETAPADWVAADLIAQAEHDELARCVLVSTSEVLAEEVARAVRDQLARAPRRAIAEPALRDRGLNLVVPHLRTAADAINRMAPEHLQVMVADNGEIAPDDLLAGAIFWGPYTPTAVGDYWAGPNHVLPTGGSARFVGPLGVDAFLVATSLVQYNAEAARGLEPARRLAVAEGLHAHAASLALRLGADTPDSP